MSISVKVWPKRNGNTIRNNGNSRHSKVEEPQLRCRLLLRPHRRRLKDTKSTTIDIAPQILIIVIDIGLPIPIIVIGIPVVDLDLVRSVDCM